MTELSEHDPRWARLARRELDAGELAELERLASSSEEGRSLLETYRPLDATERSSITRRVLSAVHDRRGPILSWKYAFWGAIPAMALTLVFAGWVNWSQKALAPLPGYEVHSGLERLSVVATSTERAASGNGEWVLRPRSAVKGPVEAYAYFAKGDALVDMTVGLEVAESGSVRVDGVAKAMQTMPAGVAEIVFVVGRRGSIPSNRAAILRAARSGTGAASWAALRVSVER